MSTKEEPTVEIKKLTVLADTLAELYEAIGNHELNGFELLATRSLRQGGYRADMAKFGEIA